jgi:outer membrane lipoprotein SlyB
MRQPIASLVVASVLFTLPLIGGAKGCLKGAAVGGVVGHVAGHHAVVGAAAGCVIEHHREKMKEKQAIRDEKKESGKAV